MIKCTSFFLKPFCSSTIIFCCSFQLTSLSFKNVQYTLYVTGDRVMPLYDSGSLGSLVEAFGIGFIIPLDQDSGMFS